MITARQVTGKELIAAPIHKGFAACWPGFYQRECAAIPSSLIASELFGHEKGGLHRGPCNADNGVLRWRTRHDFLDEGGDLPVETQMCIASSVKERQFGAGGGGG